MKFKLKAWAYCVDDGHKPEITPWGCGDYWQLPIFHSKKDAKAWRKEHPEQVIGLKLQRVMIASIPNVPDQTRARSARCLERAG